MFTTKPTEQSGKVQVLLEAEKFSVFSSAHRNYIKNKSSVPLRKVTVTLRLSLEDIQSLLALLMQSDGSPSGRGCFRSSPEKRRSLSKPEGREGKKKKKKRMENEES